ncbi:MAG: hypothetical protein J6N21_13135 [Butyrivibrio sp.]|nr:hypothetical protein [Butyrivibrio sp.]
MDGFERYKKLKKEVQEPQNNQFLDQNQVLDQYFYAEKRSKGLEIDQEQSPIYDYDATQLAQKFEQRNKGGAEDFKLRTEYYFTDTRLAQAKASKYANLANNSREKIKPFSRVYSNRWTNKRKKNASKASDEFLNMKAMMQQLKEEDASYNSLRKYYARKQIMESRIKAMSYAAVTKSKSSNHENYLKNRAKLSCYMILKDQLEHLIEGEDNQLIKDKQMIQDLNNELTLLQADIESARQGVSHYAPSVAETWRNKNNYNDEYYRNKMNEYEKSGPCDMEKAKLMSDLQTIAHQNEEEAWPHQAVLSDVNGKPISKGEREKKLWNDKYKHTQKLANKKDPADKELADKEALDAKDKLRDMDLKAVERFDKIPIPTPDDLKRENLAKYIRENLSDYYNLFKGGLKYYNSKDLPDHIEAYKHDHPEFVAKLTYLNYVDKAIDDLLRQDYGIEYYLFGNDEPTYKLESDDRYRYKKDANGQWRRDNEFRAEHYTQEGAATEYEHYNKVIKAIEIRNKNAQKRVKPLIKIAAYDPNYLFAAKNVTLSEDQKKAYAKTKKKYPDFKENSFYYYNIISDTYSLGKSEYLKRAVSRGQRERLLGSSSSALKGAATFFLQSCDFTEKKVKDEVMGITKEITVTGKTEQDQKTVENNQKWIRLWTKNDNKHNADRKAYIEENLPKFAENFVFPSAKELSTGAFLRKDRLSEILEYTRKANAFDDLQEREMDVVTKVCRQNAIIEIRVNAIKKLGEFVKSYLDNLHQIELKAERATIHAKRDNALANSQLTSKLSDYEEYLGSITQSFVERHDDQVDIAGQFNDVKDKKNSLLTPESYSVYLTKAKVYGIYNNPNIKNLYRGNISEAPASLLRKVQYDSENKPVSEQDYLNDKHNADVLSAIAYGDHKKINDLAKKELPGIYKEVKLPSLPQNVTFEWISDWVENEFIPNSEKWLEVFRRQSAIRHLSEAYPEVKQAIIEDAGFQNLRKQFEQLQGIVYSYMKMTYYIDLSQTGDEQIMTYDSESQNIISTKEERIAHQNHKKKLEEKLAKTRHECRTDIDGYIKDYNDAFNEMQNKDPNNSYIDAEDLKEKEFKKLKKADPKITREGYEIYHFHEMLYYGQRFDPKIKEAYNSILKSIESNKKLKDGSKKQLASSGSTDRDVIVYFKSVNYDETYRPATKEDEDNLQHNLNVLKAIEEGDQDKIDDVLADFIPKLWEDIELPPVPTEEVFTAISSDEKRQGLLSENEAVKAYKDKLDDYFKRMIENGSYKNLIYLQTKNLSIDNAKRNNDALRLYMMENPDFEKFTFILGPLTQLLYGYMSYEHHTDMSEGNLNVSPGSSYDQVAYNTYQAQYTGIGIALVLNLHQLGLNKLPKCGQFKRNRDLTEEDKAKLKN